MNSRLESEADDRLAAAIRSAFDDIVAATEQHGLTDADADGEGQTAAARVDLEWATHGFTERGPATLTAHRPRRASRSRWLLIAAAVAIVATGVGALTTITTRDAEPEPPATAPPSSSAPSVIDSGFRFLEPLDDGLVPFLDPAPAQPESVDRTRPFEWVRGIERVTLFGVRRVDLPPSAVAVLETAVPWDLISEGLDIETIGGSVAVLVQSDGETGLFIKDGSTTRAVFDADLSADNDGPPRDVSAEAREVARLVAGRVMDSIAQSDRVVHINTASAGSATVRYGSASEVVLFRRTLPASTRVADVALIAELVTRLDREEPPEHTAFERVSPTDLIVVVATTQELADEALATVQFDTRPTDVEAVYDQVDVRGEPTWGRWELATSSTDSACWRVTATVWGPGNTGNAAESCNEAGTDATVADAFCLSMDDRIIGAVLDGDAIPEFVGRTDPADFQATTERTGNTLSFQVRMIDDSSDLAQIDITVDGEPLECSI